MILLSRSARIKFIHRWLVQTSPAIVATKPATSPPINPARFFLAPPGLLLILGRGGKDPVVSVAERVTEAPPVVELGLSIDTVEADEIPSLGSLVGFGTLMVLLTDPVVGIEADVGNGRRPVDDVVGCGAAPPQSEANSKE